ncbi:MAG TPA: fumarylacetoacetate hydrolase family protein [Casimicrobiaceae bacterium]|nr:fumarylacetoacetate hydrolase family protein [Casimicrobiaceae bacterium]
MKLVRYGPPGREKPGLIDDEGRLRDLSRKVDDIGGDALSPASLAALRKVNVGRLPAVKGRPRLGPCVGRVGKFVAIGLNYVDHAKETGSPIPEHPIVFFKTDTSISGPNDPIMLPKDSTSTDWEVELAVVIGRRARYVEERDALRYVAGYCICNDVSEREFQIKKGGGQWGKGKGCDTFGPLGPWMVTADEVPDPQALPMWLKVNGEVRQNGSTSTMIFGVAKLLSDTSRYMTLEPGDVITTGTPPGVGMGMKPTPQYLKAGDTVELGIEGLGVQTQKVIAFKARR